MGTLFNKNRRVLVLAGILMAVALLSIPFSCSKKPDDFKSFLGGTEIVYPGAVTNVQVYPGNGRLMLNWHPSSDPSISKYVVYWNNFTDSVVVAANSHSPTDTVKCLISSLQEYTYTFFINSYDGSGNKSISTEVDNARSYGSIYQGNLFNRPINSDTPYVYSNDGSLTLKFLTPDSINITTDIHYTNSQGTAARVQLGASSSSVTIGDYEPGTDVVYQSSYIPTRGAIDTFVTNRFDTFPPIFRLIQCDKGLFSALNLPHDMSPYGSDTYLAHIWDGSTQPNGYPNIFHSDGNQPLPQHFSFDMGKVYDNLNTLEEIGRNCCHNPIDYEVWGIADLTNAETQLPGNDPGWKDEAISKGWTLLKEVVRSDDGVAALKVALMDNPPPVRYIMVRVLKTASGSDAVNLTQMTFWYKQ